MPPLPTPINGFPEFDENTPNMPPISFHALYQVLDSRVNARFASTTERDTAITAPVNGMECWTADAGKWLRLNGAWLLVQPNVRPHFQGYRTTPQSIPNTLFTNVIWTGEYYDTTNSHSASGTAFIAPFTGFYRTQAIVAFDTDNSGIRSIQMRLDGNNVNGTSNTLAPAQSLFAGVIHTPSRRLFMNAGQQLEVQVWQNTGAALNTTGGSGAQSSLFEVVWDGAL